MGAWGLGVPAGFPARTQVRKGPTHRTKMDPRRLLSACFPTPSIPGWGKWTFLTWGQGEPQVTRVTLNLDAEAESPSFVETTTDSSRLWTFTFSPPRQLTNASVTMLFASGRDSTLQLYLDHQIIRPEGIYSKGMLGVVMARGAMGYPFGRPECTPADLNPPNAELKRALIRLGVYKIAKEEHRPTEESPPHEPPVFERVARHYRLFFATGHSVEAIRRILLAQPGVERAEIMELVRIDGDVEPCDAFAQGDPLYLQSQWYLQPYQSPGPVGIGANQAWCVSLGGNPSGRATIIIIDEPYPGHPDLIRSDNTPVVTTVNHRSCYTYDAGHSVAMAAMAAAAANGIGIVGVAPEAQVLDYDLPCGGPWHEDDLVNAFVWIHDHADSLKSSLEPIVLSVSVADSTNVEPINLRDAVSEVVNEDLIPLFAACSRKNNQAFPTYPAAWDQQNQEYPLVLAVGSCTKRGAPYSPFGDIYAPAESLIVDWTIPGIGPVYSFVASNPTASLSAPQAAAATAMYEFVSGPLSPSSLYPLIIAKCRVRNGTHILNTSNLLDVTGIEDITNVYTTSGAYSNTIHWTVTDPSNINDFVISDRASCDAPWTQEADVPNNGGNSYAQSVFAPYARAYYYKLTARYGGEFIDYDAGAATPSPGYSFDQPVPPSTVSFESYPPNGGRIQWPKACSFTVQVGYWIYREIGAGNMDSCLPDHASVLCDTVACYPNVPNDGCWYDGDLLPGIPYLYRLVTWANDGQGRLISCSVPSMQVLGYSMDPAGVGTNPSDQSAVLLNRNIRVSPNPCQRGGKALLSLRGPVSAGSRLRIIDCAGRVVSESDLPLVRGQSEIREEIGSRLPTRGVYFVEIREPGTGRKVSKIVVAN